METIDIDGLVCGPGRTFHKHLAGQRCEATWPGWGHPGGVFLPSEPHVDSHEGTGDSDRVPRTGTSGVWSHHLGCFFHPVYSKARVSPKSRTSFSRPPCMKVFCFWDDRSLNLVLLEHYLRSVRKLSERCLVFGGKALQVLESHGMDGCPMDSADVSCCGNSQEGSTHLPCSR